ncbi:MAG: helix-turn-helix transcriptional regulator [Verrucomicrobiota bacterium]
MSRSSGRRETHSLQNLITGWCCGRGSRMEALPIETSDHLAEGPGVLYRWNDDEDPISTFILPEGRNPVPQSGFQHLLVIAITSDGLEVQSAPDSRLNLPFDDPSMRSRIEAILEDLRDTNAAGSVDELAGLNTSQRLAGLCQHLIELRKNQSRPTRSSAREQFVADLHAWLDGQLEGSVKLADAASEFDKSPRQIIRILKETTGTGFSEHLTMHRLIRARRLLMRTAESVMDVARKSGFNSREQFIRSFSKTFGWTPLQFRKAWNQASLANSELEELCKISERPEVEWIAKGQPVDSTRDDTAHTLVVANALHEIVELFSIDPSGQAHRSGILERGAMVFIHRDLKGSQWMVRTPGSGLERSFITPSDHAIAVVSAR